MPKEEMRGCMAGPNLFPQVLMGRVASEGARLRALLGCHKGIARAGGALQLTRWHACISLPVRRADGEKRQHYVAGMRRRDWLVFDASSGDVAPTVVRVPSCSQLWGQPECFASNSNTRRRCDDHCPVSYTHLT